MRLKMFLAVFALAALGLLFQLSNTSAGATSALTDQLLAIAKSFLIARNQVLIGDDMDRVLRTGVSTSMDRDALEERLSSAFRERRTMAQHDEAYTSFQTQLTAKNLRIDGSNAYLEAKEYTTLNLRVGNGDPLAPKTTEYTQDHLFKFFLRKQQWGIDKR